MKKKFLLMALISTACTINAQNLSKDKFGKGLSVLAKDSSFYIKASTRIQSRYDFEKLDINSDQSVSQDRAYVRRARIKFDGWAFSPKVSFKSEFDVLGGVVYDAVVKYKFYKNLEIWAGQTKLPGNRERVISSQQMQFVDRSLLNTYFQLDRDAGLQLRNSHKLGNIVFNEMLCVSQGEGLNDSKFRKIGHEYTARVEILPFGEFEGGGDYYGADLKRESKSKLSLAAGYDINEGQTTSMKVKGTDVGFSRTVSTFTADLIYKHKGFSLMAEYANRDVFGDRNKYNGSGVATKSFYTGNALNVNAGYLFKGNWEFALRYTTVRPFTNTVYHLQNEYTLGVSKYVVGHNLKVQTDLGFIENQQADLTYENDLVYRLQVEFAF